MALLWVRSPSLYLDALGVGGAVAAAPPAVFGGAAVLALLALWNSRVSGNRDHARLAALYLTIAALCAVVVAYPAMLTPVPALRVSGLNLLRGPARAHADLVLAALLSALALSPSAVGLAGLRRDWAIPSVLVPGAVIGALAAWNRPTGLEAAIAYLLLAATLALWMLLDLLKARAALEAGARSEPEAADAGRSVRVLWWRPGERGRFLIGISLCCAVAVWLTWPSWGPGIIMNLDAPRHLLRSKIMAEMFLPAGHVDGWSPYWYLGAQLFLFQSYGYFLLIGATTDLLDGWVGLHEVFKFFYMLPIVLLPAAVAWLARGLGTNRRAALAAAFASLFLGSTVGYGIPGIYGTGLLLQGVGVVLFALIVPLVFDALDGKRRAAWTAALLLGVILVTHLITGAYVLATAGVLALGTAISRRTVAPLVTYVALAIAALLLSAHALFPSLELRYLAGAVVGWSGAEAGFVRFLTSWSVGPGWFVVPAFLAALAAIVRRRGRLAVAALLLFGTALAATSTRSPLEPAIATKLVGFLLRPRALPYAIVLLAVFVGVAFDAVLARIASVPRGTSCDAIDEPTVWPWRTAASMVVCVAFVFGGLTELASLRSVVVVDSPLQSRDHDDYAQLALWLRANVASPAIVEIERRGLESSRIGGVRSVISLLNLDTGLFTLGGDQAELTRADSRTRMLRAGGLAANAEESARILRSYGVSYVIATDAIARQRLGASGEYQRVYENRTVAVYRVRNSGAWLTGYGIESGSFEFAPEHLRWQVSAQGTGLLEANVAVSWHPNWQVLVDGVAVEAIASPEHLISFAVAAGVHSVDLLYIRRRSEHIYELISLAALLCVAAGLAGTLFGSRVRLFR